MQVEVDREEVEEEPQEESHEEVVEVHRNVEVELVDSQVVEAAVVAIALGREVVDLAEGEGNRFDYVNYGFTALQGVKEISGLSVPEDVQKVSMHS